MFLTSVFRIQTCQRDLESTDIENQYKEYSPKICRLAEKSFQDFFAVGNKRVNSGINGGQNSQKIVDKNINQPHPDHKSASKRKTEDKTMDHLLSHLSVLDSATSLFTKTFIRSTWAFASLSSFRHVAKVGLEASFPHLKADLIQMLHSLETDPDLARVTVPKDPNNPPKPGWSLRIATNYADEGVRQQQQNFSTVIDATSLVFAHSVLDDMALQYCRVTAIVSPDSWERYVLEEKIKLKDMRHTADYKTLLKQKIDHFINGLTRKSLAKKCEKLFEVCRPGPEFKPIRDFSFDTKRLDSLDELRHKIVHEIGPTKGLPNGDHDIYFMQQCGYYLMALVNERFDLKVVLPSEPRDK